MKLYRIFAVENRSLRPIPVIRLFGIVSLICVLIVQSASTSLTLINFELNRETITQLFCINKQAPEKHCEGKCYLEKQIKADEDSHSEDPQTRAEFLSLVFTLDSFPSASFTTFITQIKHRFSYIIPFFTSAVIPIFHPPQ